MRSSPGTPIYHMTNRIAAASIVTNDNIPIKSRFFGREGSRIVFFAPAVFPLTVNVCSLMMKTLYRRSARIHSKMRTPPSSSCRALGSP